MIFGNHKRIIRNKFGEEGRQRDLYLLEKKVADIINDGFIKRFDDLLIYLREQYKKRSYGRYTHSYSRFMFAKVTTGIVVQGLIDYMDNVKEKDAKILFSKDMLTTICASFKLRAAMNNKITDKVCHISLIFSEKDKNRTQSDEFITAFAETLTQESSWMVS